MKLKSGVNMDNKFKPIVTDEMLSKLSSKKKIAVLKFERNFWLAMQNMPDHPFSAVTKAALFAGHVKHINLIIRS